MAGVQKPGIQAADFLQVIAGQGGEGRVHPLYRAVRIRDHDTVGGRAYGGGQHGRSERLRIAISRLLPTHVSDMCIIAQFRKTA